MSEVNNKNLMRDNNAYYDVDAGKAGSGKINLSTGMLNFSQGAHTYTTWQKGWKLGFEQSLEKVAKDGKDIYTYIDGEGNHHKFVEKYYYLDDNGKKVFVAKSEVDIDFDGKLTYGKENKEVKIKLRTTSGLSLQTDLEGFKGADKLELRSEDRAKLKSEIEQIEDEQERIENEQTRLEYEQINLANEDERLKEESERLESETERLTDETERLDREEIQLSDLITELRQTQYAAAIENSDIAKGKADFEKLIAAEKEVDKKMEAYQNMTIPNSIPAEYEKLYSDHKNLNFASGVISIEPNVSAFPDVFTKIDDDGLHYREEMLKSQGELIKRTNKNWEDIDGYKKTSGYMGHVSVAYDSGCSRFIYTDSYGKSYEKKSGANEEKSLVYSTSQSSYSGPTYNELKETSYDRNCFEDICAEIQQGTQNRAFAAELINFYNQKELIDAQKKLKIDQDKYKNDYGIADRKDTAFERIKNTITNYAEELAKIPIRKKRIEDEIARIPNVIDRIIEEIQRLDNSYNRILNEIAINVPKSLTKIQKELDKIPALLDKIKNISEAKKFELSRLEVQEPTRFLTSGEGAILAFNDDGALVAIADAYENVIYINREGGKIVSVQSGENKEIKFVYGSNGQLEKIIGADEKVTCFDYPSAGYMRVTHSDGTVSKYEHTADGLLEKVTNPAGFGLKFFYDGEQRITAVCEFTLTDSISADGWRGLNQEGERQLIKNIKYSGDYSTTLTDRDENHKTYIFDDRGRPVTVYEGVYEDFGENTKSLCIEYQDKNQAFTISDKLGADNLFKTMGAKYYAADLKGNTELIFSAWAKGAPDQNGDYKLCAKVYYKNENAPDTFTANFNKNNPDWQYLGVPVSVEEDNDTVGDRLPCVFPFTLGKGNREFDYLTLEAAGSAQISCPAFREGAWRYSTFDGEGRKLTDEDSASKTVTKYKYFSDESPLVTKAILTDKQHRKFTTTYEYNKQGSLVRKTDHNGLVEETVYNDKGRATKSFTYNLSDPTSKIYTESVLDEKGKTLADVDITGEFNSAEYTYDHNGTVSVITDAEGSKTAYGYNNGDLASISGTSDGEPNTNTIERILGCVTKVSSGGTDYTYTYDGWGRPTEIAVAGQLYAKTEYIDDFTTTVTLAGGETVTAVTDKNGNLLHTDLLKNTYDIETGLLTSSIDKSGDIEITTVYDYKDGKLKTKSDGTLTQEIEYNENGGIESNTYTIKDCGTITYGYEYEDTPDSRLKTIALPCGTEQTAQYDGLGRLTAVKSTNGGRHTTKEIYYLQCGDHATNYVSSVWFDRNESTKYRYDKKGNIVEIRENGETTAQYEYDELNRLIRENDTTYEHDNNGNIIRKKTGAMVAKYTYKSNGWRDQLIDYNGKEISYDDLGNPEIYCGKTLSWTRRNLDSIHDENEDKEISFKYNASGIRTDKHFDRTSTHYFLDGTKIIAERRNGKMLFYRYGVDGIAGLNYNGIEYVYRRNIQGDVTHIYQLPRHSEQSEESPVFVARYTYDAWGNHTVYDGNGIVLSSNEESHIGNLNSIRYRGYYYDTETGLYYLNSRYYDPVIGRFINADDVSELQPEQINGLNLYAYCGNNPVMLSDRSGRNFEEIFKIFKTVKDIFSPIIKAFKAIGKFFSIPHGGGIVYGYNFGKSKDVFVGFLYGEIEFFNGLSLAKTEIGFINVAYSPMLTDNFGLYFNAAVLGADGNIGLAGFSAKAYLWELSGGVQLGEVKVYGTVYFGVGLSFDFTNGIKVGVGLGVGYEINIEFSWKKLLKWIFGG